MTDAVSIVAGLIALVDGLGKSLRSLSQIRQISTRSAHIKDLSNELRRDLVRLQNGLRTELKNMQVQELLRMLQAMDQGLDDLQQTIENVDRYRKFRLRSLIPRRREMEAAVSSILLAKGMVRLIGTLQEIEHPEIILLDSVRLHNQALLESLTAASKSKRSWPLLKAPSTRPQEVFARIAAPDGQAELHEQCQSGRIAGTCEWFLAREEFQSWLRQPSRTRDKAMFWCRGKPGVGKTMLASKIIDQLQSRHLVAYFYMTSAKAHSAADVVTSLLKQLCLSLHVVPSRLEQILEQKKGLAGYKLELEESLEALKEVSQSTESPITIIVDGLDETNIRRPRDFTQVFNSLKNMPWKCLVTSRDTQYILLKNHNDFSEFVIEDDANEKDISNLVKRILLDNSPIDRMLNGDPELRQELINTLISRAHGMFHWVNLQICPILDQTHLAGIRCALDSIPSDIREIVDSALEMIKLQDEKRAKLANRALALLISAQAPLTAEAMCHALGIAHILDHKTRPSELDLEEIPNPESIIECCMGLIKIEPSTRVVALAHYDILKEMQKNLVNHFDPEDTAKLAKVCIAYLSLDEFSRGPCHAFDTFTNHLKEYPFLHYASHFWGYHARAALVLEKFRTQVENDILLFLRKPMNLGLSLQVAEYDPEGKQEKLAIDSYRLVEASELQIAARHGLTHIAESILRTSPDKISTPGSYGRTALHEAAQAGWEDTVRMLVEAGADSSLVDDNGKTPFVYAAEGGHAGVITFLQSCPVRSGQDLHALQEARLEALEAALCNAAEAGKTSVVAELLQLHVNPDAEKSGFSALTAASSGGHERIVRLLLDHEASVSYRDGLPSERIPLHRAIRHDYVEIAALLLRHGANINACDDLGRTALFETLSTSNIRGAVLLLKKGINISRNDHRGDNVLHEAARRGRAEHASHFVDRVVDVDMLNKDGLTPLHLAVQYGHLNVTTLLLKNGAFIGDSNASRLTPLHHAAQHGYLDIATLLVEAGADVRCHNAVGLTPLHYAAQHGNLDIATLLVEKGADVSCGDASGLTPSHHAAQHGNLDIAALLMKNGASIQRQDGEKSGNIQLEPGASSDRVATCQKTSSVVSPAETSHDQALQLPDDYESDERSKAAASTSEQRDC